MLDGRQLLAVLVVSAASAPAYAFDYIEHLWFTDDACRRVQEALAPELAANPALEAPYLALALACPATWERPYCDRGDKLARGHLNVLASPESRAYSVTLGDFSALGDHVSRQGPVQNLPRARSRGLVHHTLKWLTSSPGGVGGPIGDVAEDACEVGERADLERARRDIDERLSTWWHAGELDDVPPEKLRAVARALLPRGPHDPPMKYSFDNPHYLDLVVRNHHHFGEAAFDAWNGFHGVATQMSGRTCAELVVVDPDRAEDLADHVPGYETIDWDDVADDQLAGRVCAMLSEVVRGRLERWSKAAPAALTAPARVALDRIRDDPRLADLVVVHVLSLVFEGTGLHYLQDGLAGGHMRTIRSREALVEVRHDHDADNRDGVVAMLRTPHGTTSFVAWGDGYLLGRSPAPRCDWASEDSATTSTCLLRQQRGLLAASTIASLLDWAYGGVIYRGLQCESPASLERAICMALPVEAPRAGPHPSADEPILRLLPGTLPVPPPDFSYESLSIGFGFAPWTATSYVGAKFAAFQELDIPAHWLRSWQVRLEGGFGEGPRQSLSTDVGFGFHYRFYARVMLDLVPTAFVGLRDFSDGTDVYAGLAPRVGLSVLPEGWIKIPIEFSLAVEQPLVFFATDNRPLTELDTTRPRLSIGFGLAYMH